MSAPQLSDQEFKEIDTNIRSGKHVPADQRAAHEKALIERTLGVAISSKIIELKSGRKVNRESEGLLFHSEIDFKRRSSLNVSQAN